MTTKEISEFLKQPWNGETNNKTPFSVLLADVEETEKFLLIAASGSTDRIPISKDDIGLQKPKDDKGAKTRLIQLKSHKYDLVVLQTSRPCERKVNVILPDDEDFEFDFRHLFEK